MMANHGFISSKKNFKKDQVLKDLQEINDRRFAGFLKIENSKYGTKGSWFISYQGEGWFFPEGFNIWIRSPRMLEHRHQHGWIYYLEIVFSSELATKYNGLLSDECCDDKWKPDVNKYPTYKKWMESQYSGLKKRNPKTWKKLIDSEMDLCPEELRDC